jgi:hypothetical protein
VKLDRNINLSGLGKYRLWNERDQAWVDDCGPGEEHEYFVIMLKDRNAQSPLDAYATMIGGRDPEFSAEVRQLADRAGIKSPFCRDPD